MLSPSRISALICARGEKASKAPPSLDSERWAVLLGALVRVAADATSCSTRENLDAKQDGKHTERKQRQVGSSLPVMRTDGEEAEEDAT